MSAEQPEELGSEELEPDEPVALGPVELVVVGFSAAGGGSRIVPALSEVVNAGLVRILDIVFVTKQADGSIIAVEIEDLDPLDARGFDELDGEVSGLLSEDDLDVASAVMPPGSSAALIVWEDVWARRLAEALRLADAEVLMHERVPRSEVEAARAAARS